MTSYLLLPLLSFVLVCISFSAAEPKCSEGCFRRIDIGGNESCDCCHNNATAGASNPCLSHPKCANGEECVPTQAVCTNAFGLKCKLDIKPKCKPPCPKKTECDPKCQIAYHKQCKVCLCGAEKVDDLCEGYNGCNSDQECYIDCEKKGACNPVAMCRKRCGDIDCPKGCLKYIDTVGCPACSCCNTCVTKKCENTEECVLQEKPMISGPLPVAECRKN